MKKDNLPHILYADDMEKNLQAFQASFRRDFKIFIARSAAEAKTILSEETVHVLISDQKMPGTPGVELLQHSLEKYPDQVRILLTAYTDFEALKDAVNKGYIFKYLVKPWDDKVLKATILEAYELYQKNKNNGHRLQEVEARKRYLEEEIAKLEEIIKRKKEEIDKFIDNS